MLKCCPGIKTIYLFYKILKAGSEYLEKRPNEANPGTILSLGIWFTLISVAGGQPQLQTKMALTLLVWNAGRPVLIYFSGLR